MSIQTAPLHATQSNAARRRGRVVAVAIPGAAVSTAVVSAAVVGAAVVPFAQATPLHAVRIHTKSRPRTNMVVTVQTRVVPASEIVNDPTPLTPLERANMRTISEAMSSNGMPRVSKATLAR